MSRGARRFGLRDSLLGILEDAGARPRSVVDGIRAELREGVSEPRRSDPSRDMAAVLLGLGAEALGLVEDPCDE